MSRLLKHEEEKKRKKRNAASFIQEANWQINTDSVEMAHGH